MNRKKITLIVFWFVTIICFECIYRMTVFKNIIDKDFIQMLVFCLPIAGFIYIITTLFNDDFNKKISTFILTILYVMFFAQMVYFKVYNSVFSVYSMTNGGQVLEFWRTILSTIIDNWYNFVCISMPVLLFLILKKKFFDFSRNNFMTLGISLASFVFLVSMTFLCINVNKTDIYSSYNLYFNTHTPILSTKKFGLITTMGIDLNRSLFGMSERKVEIIIDNTKTNKNNSTDFYNITNIDFDDLIENEEDENIMLMHKYFSSLDGTKKNEYTGMFKGKNVVFLLAESLDPIAIDKELTPTLYKLANSGFNFTNYYAPLYPASTADGEFRTEWSLISSRGDTLTLYAHKDVYSPYIFANSFSNYNINIYHNYDGDYYNRRKYFEGLGYKSFTACNYGLELDCNTFHESDFDMVNITMDNYINSSDPFFAYYITLSGHLSYNRASNKVADKNWKLIENLPYSDKVKGYLAANIEVDRALEALINRLTEAGKLDDTVIVLTPDHYPYGLSNDQINEVSEINRDDDFDIYKSDLIIWNSAMEKNITVTKVGSNPDVLPTLLNLFGVEYDSRFIIGQDLLSDKEGLIIFSNRSWITDTARYNSVTNEAISKTSDDVDISYINRTNINVNNQFKVSNLVLQTNYYEKVFKQEK